MQGVDYTTLMAVCHEIKQLWVPAKVEQIYQRDRYTLLLALRTVNQRGWFLLSWHPQAARLCMGNAPPRVPDTFTFSDQLRHQLNGLALVDIDLKMPWERVVELKFAKRPQDAHEWSLFVEVMNKYSNAILTNAEERIVTAAHQVSAKQSRYRPIQTGEVYSLPPKRLTSIPKLQESFEHWQQQVQLVPKSIMRALTQTYSGLSSALVIHLLHLSGLSPESQTTELSPEEWRLFFEQWQWWLTSLEEKRFYPCLFTAGYSVLGQNPDDAGLTISQLLCHYYEPRLEAQSFEQLRHQLRQCVTVKLKKLQSKAQQFELQLAAVNQADQFREKADLLMAYLHEWTPGMASITLATFETGEPCKIPLDPERNAVQNAQFLYKRHQKLKRSQNFVEPLLKAVQLEISYLEQVDDAIAVVETYQDPIDLMTLQEIRDELVQQNYLSLPDYRRIPENKISYRSFLTPNGFTVLIGRNNKQNDQLTFRTAGDYDLWFHAQEISGSHVLLRLDAGANVEDQDLAYCANLAAYFSRARHSDQVPIVYTQPKYVFKPKGAQPGMTVYTHETVLWGNPKLSPVERIDAS